VPAQATAFAHRDQSLVGFVGSGWETPADEPRERRWVDGLWAQLAPQASGAYANFLAEDGEAAVRRSYPGETGQRLAAIKRRYDPENLFRVNQNIRPS
jgi:FAD/FMN-containing dehydrogenase